MQKDTTKEEGCHRGNRIPVELVHMYLLVYRYAMYCQDEISVFMNANLTLPSIVAARGITSNALFIAFQTSLPRDAPNLVVHSL